MPLSKFTLTIKDEKINNMYLDKRASEVTIMGAFITAIIFLGHVEFFIQGYLLGSIKNILVEYILVRIGMVLAHVTLVLITKRIPRKLVKYLAPLMMLI